jgi:hypothetical protein
MTDVFHGHDVGTGLIYQRGPLRVLAEPFCGSF